jgi:probable O-glycosylation ligase (exosortase A-associated)
MRTLLLTAAVLGMLPLVLLQPHVGVLLYFWISLMNPHRLVWGGGASYQYALIIALVTMAAWLFSRERKMLPLTVPTILLGLLWLWVSLTTLQALSPAAAQIKWELFSKILLMTFVAIPMIRSRTRLQALIWVIVGSIGFYGVKGGGFSIVTGGAFHVLGPQNTFIGDNNAIALAMDMVLPLMWYLRATSREPWVRYGLTAAMGLTVFAVVTTYSRGGLLGLGVVLFAALLRSRHRLSLALAASVAAAALLAVMPGAWYDRMNTISNYQEDSSAQGRIRMWHMALNIAQDRPILGGGYNVFKEPAVYPRYNPDAPGVLDVHSIYFEMLGEHGVVGLALFLALGTATLWQLRSIRRQVRQRKDLVWANELAGMVFVSLAGYATAGAFLSLATFDLYYLLIGVAVMLNQIVKESLKEQPLPAASGGVKVPAPWLTSGVRVNTSADR